MSPKPKPPARKQPSREATVLRRRLLAYFADAEDARARGDKGAGDRPTNAEDLARWIALNPEGAHDRVHPGVKGEAVSPQAVRGWKRAEYAPTLHYVPLLESLFGAPWRYLVDPKNPWPIEDADVRALLASLAAIRDADDWRRVARALRGSEARSPAPPR